MENWIPIIIIFVIFAAVAAALYFWGRRMQKRQEENMVQLEANKQTVSLFVIDKKKLPLNKAGLPDIVLKQTPFYMRRSKTPILRVKAGPQVVNLMCDPSIFDSVPVKKEVKASVSGIYVLSVRGIRGGNVQEVKKGRFAALRDKLLSRAGANPVK